MAALQTQLSLIPLLTDWVFLFFVLTTRLMRLTWCISISISGKFSIGPVCYQKCSPLSFIENLYWVSNSIKDYLINTLILGLDIHQFTKFGLIKRVLFRLKKKSYIFYVCHCIPLSNCPATMTKIWVITSIWLENENKEWYNKKEYISGKTCLNSAQVVQCSISVVVAVGIYFFLPAW